MSLQWRPCAGDHGPELVVTQGDLTTAHVDAIVSATNCFLSYTGGVAASIIAKGGSEIVGDCNAWIQQHGRLLVGKAMSTRAGHLPCRHVIHSVGLAVENAGSMRLTREKTRRLRDSVRSVLMEAERLGLTSIAMPGISSSSSGYAAELSSTQIVGECVRFVCEKASTTSLKTIVLMDTNALKHSNFVDAVWAAAERSTSGNDPEEVSELAILADQAVMKVSLASQALPLPPPSPIEVLSPLDPEYKRILAELGAHGHGVVSIRRVRVPPRLKQYEKTKLAIQGGRVHEVEPLYHGTPERWRATAIALGGFDLSIRLCGRSHGDGVYTSTETLTPVGFTKGQGSVLRLRGLVVWESSHVPHNTIIHGYYHVFPDPTALLSLTIIDYAPEDELDRMQVQRFY